MATMDWGLPSGVPSIADPAQLNYAIGGEQVRTPPDLFKKAAPRAFMGVADNTVGTIWNTTTTTASPAVSYNVGNVLGKQ